MVPRPTRGEWIEMNNDAVNAFQGFRLAPPGASGLKCAFRSSFAARRGPRPTRGEWIEIFSFAFSMMRMACLAPPGASGLKLALL